MVSTSNSRLYDEYYYRHDCGDRPYQRDEAWLHFFDGIAENIVNRIKPKSVMDAGCAMGFLVEGLRKHDVEAFGVDISSYAISLVHESIKQYCWEGSVTSPFPTRYDLITCIEVLEHLPPNEADLAINNLCQFTDDILFSSTPFDYKEITHLNVRQPEYWAEKFSEQGFFRDLDFDGSFLTPWAVRFRKIPWKSNELVRQYEKHFFLLKKENFDLRSLSVEAKDLLSNHEKSVKELQESNEKLGFTVETVHDENDGLRNSISELVEKINYLEYTLETVSKESDADKNVLSDYEGKIHRLTADYQITADIASNALNDIDIIQNSETWKLMMAIGRLRQKIAPSSSWRAKVLHQMIVPIKNLMNKDSTKKKRNRKHANTFVGKISGIIKEQGLSTLIKKSWDVLNTDGLGGLFRKLKVLSSGQFFPTYLAIENETIQNENASFLIIQEVRLPQQPEPHSKSIDIIICVHNALIDVQKCIQSVLQNSTSPYRVIIVNDGSDDETTSYLRNIGNDQKDIVLIENSSALGYTKAANQGILASSAAFVVLLNSDTIVPAEWLDRMIQPFLLNSRVGVVGPISNTASWQSVPQLFENGDWAQNTPPEGISIDKMGKLVSRYSPQLFPSVPLLNGFCLMMRRELIADIGLLDEEIFPMGYGEEDDYIFRARKAGWQLAWADDVYVYHAQSKSFSHERRKQLTEKGIQSLQEKHGSIIINESCAYAQNSIVLNGIRSFNSNIYERSQWVEHGREKFSGKRILFLLPVAFAGGGANVIFDEARCMIDMGVDVRIFNLEQNRASFIQSYPNLDIPVTFGEVKDLETFVLLFDAVVATVYYSVHWLKNIQLHRNKPVPILGYYIQDFEPKFFPLNSTNYTLALASYGTIPNIKRFTKTKWTHDTVFANTKHGSEIAGISINTSLFRPRFEKPEKPIRIGAMIRPNTAYREPEKTLRILKAISDHYNDHVEIWLFGVGIDSPEFLQLPIEFKWKSAGLLSQKQVANFLSMIDIFVDFSSHQAMGLTALEAMSCGCCVIVPEEGGAKEFVESGENGFLVNTKSMDDCEYQLKNIIDDPQLRHRIRLEAIKSIHKYYPEQVACNILNILFGEHN